MEVNIEEFAELKVNGKIVKLPIYKASIGQNVIDITKLYNETGYFTYDPGFISTAACDSSITYIDGDNGILRHRGYDIKDLAEKSNFMDTCYLLLHSELPNQQQQIDFNEKISHHSLVHDQMRNLFKAFRYSAHPMAVLLSAVGSLSAFYHEFLDVDNAHERELAAIRMIAKVPTLAAMAYKYSIGQPFIYPQNNLGFTENFLHMMFATPCEKYIVNPIISNILEKIFILHADHEQNASTSTVRISGSSGANPFACISAGIASLWGPSHGGANEAVVTMLAEIGSVDNVVEFIKKVKDKTNQIRLMGFGHRVYKNYDPRAAVLKKACTELFQVLGKQHDPLLQIALELEKIALSDPYFIDRKLYPNVDFYSGIIYKAIGIPPQMFTVMFAVARTAGWIAQWKEMHEEKDMKICRPRQLYVGQTKRNFFDIKNRI